MVKVDKNGWHFITCLYILMTEKVPNVGLMRLHTFGGEWISTDSQVLVQRCCHHYGEDVASNTYSEAAV